jgi:hypothetical protein
MRLVPVMAAHGPDATRVAVAQCSALCAGSAFC